MGIYNRKMIGKTVSHYKILEKLGEGGMGVVYKAEDTKLNRLVALKFLPQQFGKNEEEKRRFIHEAKAAAALEHPNICNIHEIDEAEDGQMFISMACYEGETLKDKIDKGPLKIDETINLIVQLAEGLNYAHKKDIIHRDIKSANIFITKEGLLKILDYGLAKLKGQSELTKASTTLGTVAYMSPEQSAGKDVDYRTDVWSLGVVLYEMVTGQLPFRGDYEQAIVYSIMNEDPDPVTALRTGVPMQLEQVLYKLLSKKPSERYQHVDDLLVDLKKIKEQSQPGISATKREIYVSKKPLTRRSTLTLIIVIVLFVVFGGYFIFKGKKGEKPSTVSVIKAKKKSESRWKNSIAVLSFADMSPEKDQEYFCDGIAEEIINSLSQIKNLRVVARTSAFSFKGKNIDVRDIGKTLNVEMILEGSIRKTEDRIRITAQLVKVKDGFHLWSEKYDRKMKDVFDIQDEISLTIVEKLKLNLLGDTRSRLIKGSTKNLEAYNLYLKGRYYWNKRTEADIYQALEYFQNASKIDTNFALAYTGIADCYSNLGWYDYLPPKETYLKVKAAAERALEIDSRLAEAYTSYAHVVQEYEWDFAAAEKSYLKAIKLNPNYATSHHWYALFLSQMGRHEEALAEIDLARQLDPLSLIIKTAYAGILYHDRKYDEAIKVYQGILELNHGFMVGQTFYGYPMMLKGMYEEAIHEFKKALAMSKGQNLIAKSYLGCSYALHSNTKEANKIVNELIELSEKQYISPVMIGNIYSDLGKTDLAFEWWEKGFEIRDHWLIWLKVDPRNDALRSDPKFVDLLKRIGYKQ